MLKDPILIAEGLTKNFGGIVAVSNVDLKVRPNSIHAVIGPNGAGKSTFFNLLTKFHQPTAGRISFEGRDITYSTPAAIARQGIGRSFQISAVFGSMTVRENIRAAMLRGSGIAHHFWRPARVLRRFESKVDEAIEAVSLQKFPDTQAAKLSYGRKRALEIAITLALEPKLLLLDEPMAGLGSEDIDRIGQLIKALGQTHTVLMVEHNMRVVSELCDVVTVMQRGEKLAEGTYETVSRDPRVIEAYVGPGSS